MSEPTRPRRISVILVDRANYGRLKPVMRAIQERPELELQVICAGTMVLERFDQPVDIVRADGFPVDSQIYMELEGSTPAERLVETEPYVQKRLAFAEADPFALVAEAVAIAEGKMRTGSRVRRRAARGWAGPCSACC